MLVGQRLKICLKRLDRDSSGNRYIEVYLCICLRRWPKGANPEGEEFSG